MQSEGNKPHWTHTLFVEHPELYLPFLEQAMERVEDEANALVSLFNEFGVPPNGRLLDAACGIGRHSVELARRGYSVTGVDLSPLFVEKARDYADEVGVSPKFVVGDVSKVGELVEQDAPFDAFINMFTSHGYYGRNADLDLFKQLRRLASPDAVLVVLTSNRDWIVQNFSPEGLSVAEPIRILQHRTMDLETSSIINDWEFYEGHSENVKLRLRLEMGHRLYSLHEFKELINEAGWRYLRGLGKERGEDSNLGPLTFESKDMWVVARA